MKKIVIIGAGAEQLYAYELARRQGHYVIATDNNPNAPSAKYADYFILASTRNAKETLHAIKDYCEENGNIDGVMTIANDVPYTVAVVADYFNLKGHSIESSMLAQDKFLMKMAFKSDDVPCPDFWKISTLTELRVLIDSENLSQFVIKPIDGRGARGVLLLSDKDDLEWAFRESLSWSERKEIIVEKFIAGMQISSESYLLNGKAYTPALSERNYSRMKEFSPYIIEDGGTIPAPVSSGMVKKINKLIEDGSSSLGVTEGIVKGDIVINQHGEPQIIATSGVDLVDIVMKQALQIQVTKKMLTPCINKSTSVRYWFPKPGRILSIKGEEKLKSLPGVIRYGFFREVGENQPVIKMHPDRFGYVIVEGKDRRESIGRVEHALSVLDIGVQ